MSYPIFSKFVALKAEINIISSSYNFTSALPSASLTPPPHTLFIAVPVPRQENEWPCICVFEVSTLPFFSTIFQLEFGTVLTMW
jgi:hypothetical protein